jgi:hypothetical protein
LLNAKREKRLKIYSKNFMYRRKMKKMFLSWRANIVKELKERVRKDVAQYEVRL